GRHRLVVIGPFQLRVLADVRHVGLLSVALPTKPPDNLRQIPDPHCKRSAWRYCEGIWHPCPVPEASFVGPSKRFDWPTGGGGRALFAPLEFMPRPELREILRDAGMDQLAAGCGGGGISRRRLAGLWQPRGQRRLALVQRPRQTIGD